MDSYSTSLETQIENIARQKTISVEPAAIEGGLNVLLTLKIQTDNMDEGNIKPKMDVAVLYRRFLIFSTEKIIPMAEKMPLTASQAKKLGLLKSQLGEAQTKLKQIIDNLKLQSNKGSTGAGQYNAYSSSGSYQQPQSQKQEPPKYMYPSIDGGISSLLTKPVLTTMPGLHASGSNTYYPNLELGTNHVTTPVVNYQATNNIVNQYPSTNHYQTSYQQAYNPQAYAPTTASSSGYPTLNPTHQHSPYDTQSLSLSSFGSYTELQRVNSNGSDTGFNQKQALRTVICPYEIIQSFVKVASPNTRRDLETCAILAGHERSDTLIIDTLIVPEQEGHVDHCFMTDEIGMFEAQIKHKVMTIGWIHTHPQYSLFLSSVDVHNQLGYQMQLPEAVAIVYSPIEKDKFRAFKVKDSRVDEIQRCTKKGFHEHKDAYGQEAFEVSTHIQYVEGTQNGIYCKVVDLRHS